MDLQHIAIWTRQLEEMKMFYQKYFGGIPNQKYVTEKEFEALFSSYFLTFDSGAQLELMEMEIIPQGNIAGGYGSLGFTHIAFNAGEKAEVNTLVEKLRKDGYKIAGEPRVTGDDYYEAVVLDPDGNRVEIIVPPR